jgi:D-alanine-D-alanine ligase
MTLRVNVLMGGPSAEHEVSLNSAFGIITNLDRSKYSIRAVFISKSKEFFFRDIPEHTLSFNELINLQNYKGPFLLSDSKPIWEGCGVVFLGALHGSFGEDGTIQGALDAMNLPYTGSGVTASALAMNKILSKFIYIQNGLTVPPFSIFGKNFTQTTIAEISLKHSFPCFVKAPQSGSSRLMGKADSVESLSRMLTELRQCSPNILIETAIKGIEFTCAVIEEPDGTPTALPPIEIRPKTSFFDYTAKYTDGASEEIVPAPYPEELLERIKAVALTAHNILGCSGVSRTDMIYSDDKLFVLETNTLPGFTRNSLLPKAFMATGGSYSQLLDKLIQSALFRKKTGAL